MFNLATGAKGVVSDGYTSDITPAGNGWYRCSVTTTATAATWYAEVDIGEADNDIGYTGDGTSGIYIWGAQLEAGASATSYIPTAASQVTRAVDVASMTGTNFSSWYNALGGTWVVEGDAHFRASDTSEFVGISDGTSNNCYSISANNVSSVNRIQLSAYVAGASQLSGVYGSNGTYTESASVKIAAAFVLNDARLAQDGAQIGANDTVCALPPVDRLNIGTGYVAGNRPINGHIKRLTYYPVRLANATLQALSA
jgi:hypothetical protein